VALVRPMPPVSPASAPTPGGYRVPPAPPGGVPGPVTGGWRVSPAPPGGVPGPVGGPATSPFPVGSSPPFHIGPTSLPTPELQAIQDRVFGNRPFGQPAAAAGSPATVSFPGWQAQQSQIVPNPHIANAIVNRLARVNNMAGWPEGWHPGWWRNPGGGGIGPPLPPTPAPDPYPIGFPNIQALVDYFRGRYG